MKYVYFVSGKANSLGFNAEIDHNKEITSIDDIRSIEDRLADLQGPMAHYVISNYILLRTEQD